MKVALIGNQNSGKTTLFNALTGANQKVGNWPGVTIERKEGHIKNTDIVVVDLPGIYSLSPYTSEEEVSRTYVVDEKPDVIINIVDATCIERSLYLTTQLLELGTNVVIALNMADIVEREGIHIDSNQLSSLLKTTVVPISAKKKTGIGELIKVLVDETFIPNANSKIYSKDVEHLIEQVKNTFNLDTRFAAVKVIESDPRYSQYISSDELKIETEKIEKSHDMDMEQLIASQRYDYISSVKQKSVQISSEKKNAITDKLDKIFLNKWLAIPIFIFIMALVYLLSVGLVGGLTVSLVDALFNGAEEIEFNFFGLVWTAPFEIMGLGPWLSSSLGSIGASEWSRSLVADGIVAGVGAVLNFVPQIIILFLCLSILETTGYMSRIAFFLDRVFHKFGLSGKSLIPFIVGSGCSVPGVMATRTIEDEDEKKLTIALTPFIPCSAKLPIIALFSGFFFAPNVGWLVTLSLYVLAIVVILLSGVIIKKLFFKNSSSAFISELPAYKAPNASYVARDVFDKTTAFIKRAGTIILLCSVIVWFLVSFTWNFHYIDGETYTIDESLLANVGRSIAWIFYPMLGDLSWAASVSAIQGLVAKEQVVSSMATIAGVAEEGGEIFNTSLFSFFNSWSAYAFMVFNLFSAPCFGAIGAMRREFSTSKQLWSAIAFQTGLAWVLASLIGIVGMAVSSI